MKRKFIIGVFTVTALAASVRPALASDSWWAWLEEFSGPGPFHGKTILATGCWQDKSFRPSPVATDSPSAQQANLAPRILPCAYYDHGWYNVDANSTKDFPRLHAGMWEIGASARLFDWLDLGAGLGRISFHPEGNGDHGKATFTPFRVVLRPLLFIPAERDYRRMLGAVSVFVKETRVQGPITGADFGVPANPFNSDKETKTSWGITFDLTALCPKKVCSW